MAEDDLVFVARKGAVWACWLSGKPAVRLGGEAEVLSAMRQYARGTGRPAPKPATRAAPAPPPPAPAPPIQAKAPTRPPGPPVERAKPRHELTIIGRIFTVGGSREVTIRDLSETGCQFFDPACQMASGARLTIKIGTIGPIEAGVRWRRDHNVGIEFTSALYPSVLEHIRAQFDLRRR